MQEIQTQGLLELDQVSGTVSLKHETHTSKSPFLIFLSFSLLDLNSPELRNGRSSPLAEGTSSFYYIALHCILLYFRHFFPLGLLAHPPPQLPFFSGVAWGHPDYALLALTSL